MQPITSTGINALQLTVEKYNCSIRTALPLPSTHNKKQGFSKFQNLPQTIKFTLSFFGQDHSSQVKVVLGLGK